LLGFEIGSSMKIKLVLMLLILVLSSGAFVPIPQKFLAWFAA